MIKNKYFEFTFLLLAVIITRALDIIGTFYYTPDLRAELNPMVQVFGFQWIGIICLNIAGIAFTGSINYYSLFKTKVTCIEHENLSFHEFLSILYFNKLVPWNWKYVYTKGLNGKDQSLNMYGWLIPRILIYVGIVIMVFYAFLDFSPAYREIHKFFVVPMYFLMFSSLPVCFYYYHKFRYQSYEKQQ